MLPDRGGEVILRRLRERNLPVHVAVTTGEVAPERLAALRRMKPEDVFRYPYNLVDLGWDGDLARAG